MRRNPWRHVGVLEPLRERGCFRYAVRCGWRRQLQRRSAILRRRSRHELERGFAAGLTLCSGQSSDWRCLRPDRLWRSRVRGGRSASHDLERLQDSLSVRARVVHCACGADCARDDRLDTVHEALPNSCLSLACLPRGMGGFDGGRARMTVTRMHRKWGRSVP